MVNTTPPSPSSRWERLEALFVGALDRPPAERDAYLESECAADRALRHEVEEMLRATDSPSPFRIEQKLAERLGGPEASHSLAPGTRVGVYRIDALIGEGGMGEVYAAERVDGEYQQRVALKVLRPGALSPEMVRRFRAERQILARLVHPDIAAILDGGQLDDGRPYLVLQFVEGVPITEYCGRYGLGVADRLRLFRRVADAVQFAHGRLVVHRDLKPSNILINTAGEPKLLDFGIAKMLEPDDSDADRTHSGFRMLTPEHAAPEQILGEPTTTATDVYALGVLLFQLLTGQRPFATANRSKHDVEQLIVHEAPPAPSSVMPDRAGARQLRGDLDRIVLMALRKEPSRRYVSAGQLAEDVDRHLAGLPVRAQPDTYAYRTRKLLARNRGVFASVAIVLLLFATFTVVTAVQARRVARERDRAQAEHNAAESVIGLLTRLFERSNPTIVPGGDTIRVAALLDEGERRVDALSSQPALQARMWRVLGNMHAARSRFDRAKALLQRAYETQQRLAGPNDSIAAAIYLELARAVEGYAGPNVARPMFDSSIVKLRRSLGPGHADVAIGLEERAVLETDSSRRRALMDSANRIRVETKTIDSMSMAGNYNREGSDQWSRGHWALAYAYFDSSLRLLDKLLPPDHANRLHVMNNVASALTKLREWDRADSVQHLLLDAQRRSLGTNSVEYANTLESYSLSRAERGRYAEAEADLRISLATYRQLVGPTHWHTPNTLRNLGLILVADGKVDEGLALLDTALMLTRAINGDTSTAVGYLNGQLSHVYLMLGRLDDAHQSTLIAERLLGPRLAENDSRRSDLEFWLGLDAFARGDTTAAVGHFTAARDGYMRLMAPDDASVIRATCMLGVALVSAGRVDAGARPLREACPRQSAGAFPSPVINRWAREALARLRP